MEAAVVAVAMELLVVAGAAAAMAQLQREVMLQPEPQPMCQLALAALQKPMMLTATPLGIAAAPGRSSLLHASTANHDFLFWDHKGYHTNRTSHI